MRVSETHLKICGLRDPNHALVAAESGADLLGFVFVEGVRRQLTPAQGAEIISEYRREHGPGGPKLVGLFANQPADFVNRVAADCGLDFVQLCGDEQPDYWGLVRPGIIKQIKVRSDGSVDETIKRTLVRVDEVLTAGHRALLDAYEPGQLGGTGTSFDWAIARAIAEQRDIVLAGGLTSENVGQAITRVVPWGVDVSSGVETDGTKDEVKIRAFAAAVRSAVRP
jgi:phosphoribosylanthranilate isomerase